MISWRRRILYWIEFFGRRNFDYGILLLYALGLRLLTEGWHGGIRISDCANTGRATLTRTPLFVEATQKALDQIAEADERRYRRIQKEIKCIVNDSGIKYAAYQRVGRICHVNFPAFKIVPGTSNYERNLSIYAASIIHEATHGVIRDYSVENNDITARRIEHLCHLEEERFMVRLLGDRDFARERIKPFDYSLWERERNRTFIERILQWGKRWGEIVQQFRNDRI